MFKNFLRKTPQAKLPLTVGRKNTYILPTRHGLLFIVILAAMLAGSINYNNNLGFLLVFLLGAMAVVSMFHTHKNLVGIKILSISAKPVFAGETAVFNILVSSGAHRRKALVWTIEKPLYNIADISLLSEQIIAVKTSAAGRGMLRRKSFKISTRFPLGLFYAWTKIFADISCVVYPSPLPGPDKLHKTTDAGGMGKETKSISAGADDFMGLKAYQPGDPVKNISWKTFSRGQGLFIKDFEGNKSVGQVYDYETLEGQDTETRLSRLCHMILKAEAAGIEYGLKLPETFIAPSKGQKHCHVCLRALALFDPGTEKS
jgi:uncharacterized protein (DUF58 family)